MGKSETDVLLRAHIEIFLIRDYPKVKDTWVPIADLIQALKDKNVCKKREYLTHRVVMAALEKIDFVQLNENKTKIRRRKEDKDSQISQKSQRGGKTGKSTKGGSKSGKPSVKPQPTRGSPVKSKQGESTKPKKQPEPIGSPKTRRSDATKTKQQAETQKQHSKRSEDGTPARRGKKGTPVEKKAGNKDLRRTVFAFGLKPAVKEIDLMTICVEHGQVKGIYFEGHENGPERVVAEIIITKSIKKAQGGKKPTPENISNLRTVFIVFASQGQATKLVKARGRNASIDGPLDFRCIHKYDYLRVAKRNGLGFDNVSLTSTPGFSPRIPKPALPRFPSLPGSMVVNTPKNGPSAWEQRKFMCKRPRSAPGPRPYSSKVGIAREVPSPSNNKRWKMRSPRIDEGMPLNCKMEPLSLQNMKFLHRSPPVKSYNNRFLSLSRNTNDPGLSRRSPTVSSSSFTSRHSHSFGNLDVAKGPPDLHTAGFFWMRNPLYHDQPSYRPEARKQQPTKPMLQVTQDPPALGAEAGLQLDAKMAANGNVEQTFSGANWDPSFAAPMDPATIMTALDLMPLNFKTPSPTPPPVNQN